MVIFYICYLITSRRKCIKMGIAMLIVLTWQFDFVVGRLEDDGIQARHFRLPTHGSINKLYQVGFTFVSIVSTSFKNCIRMVQAGTFKFVLSELSMKMFETSYQIKNSWCMTGIRSLKVVSLNSEKYGMAARLEEFVERVSKVFDIIGNPSMPDDVPWVCCHRDL